MSGCTFPYQLFLMFYSVVKKHFVNCKMVSNDPNDMWMTDNNYVYRGGNRVKS